jgi:hypothetical protein
LYFGNSNEEGIMTVTDEQLTRTQAALRLTLEEVKARLSAISDTLSDSEIDGVQLRKDAEELNAITRRVAWLADVSTPRALHLN